MFSSCGALLAVGLDEVIGLIFVLIAVGSWLFNLISGKANEPANTPVRPRPKPRDQNVQNEVKTFPAERPGNRPPPPPARSPLGNRQAPAVSRPAPPPPAKKRKQATAEPASDNSGSRRRVGAEIAARQAPGNLNLGTGLTAHVSDYMQPKADREVAQDVGNRVSDSVSRHLGTIGTAGSNVSTGNVSPGKVSSSKVSATSAGDDDNIFRLELIQSMRKPESIRRAILMNEIMSKPLALRKRS